MFFILGAEEIPQIRKIVQAIKDNPKASDHVKEIMRMTQFIVEDAKGQIKDVIRKLSIAQCSTTVVLNQRLHDAREECDHLKTLLAESNKEKAGLIELNETLIQKLETMNNILIQAFGKTNGKLSDKQKMILSAMTPTLELEDIAAKVVRCETNKTKKQVAGTSVEPTSEKRRTKKSKAQVPDTSVEPLVLKLGKEEDDQKTIKEIPEAKSIKLGIPDEVLELAIEKVI